MTVAAQDNISETDTTTCPVDAYIKFIASPMHALLVAAGQAVAEGYTVDEAKDALDWFMWAAARIQEEPRDAEL